MMYFNLETLYVTLAAVCVGAAGWFGLSTALGDSETIKGVNVILIGATVLAGDIYCRKRHPEPGRWYSIFDSVRGACYSFLPGWTVGSIIVACGIGLIIQAVR